MKRYFEVDYRHLGNQIMRMLPHLSSARVAAAELQGMQQPARSVWNHSDVSRRHASPYLWRESIMQNFNRIVSLLVGAFL
jgi:hypothetical protein